MAETDTCQLLIEKKGSIVKVGTGEVGGKAIGFPFLETMINLEELSKIIAPHQVCIPETWVLATGVFDDFLAQNNLQHCVEANNDEIVRSDFLKAKMPDNVILVLKDYLKNHKGPIAVRSSALSEDASTHPAAGLYCTFMLPNNSASNALNQLIDAIKLVYASLFSREAYTYLHHHNIPHENEKMAVILEEVVGNAHENLFFPLVSGVAQSLNFFPVGNMHAGDGAATVALGLGRKIVDGHGGMRFCPKYPTLRPQFRSIPDMLAMNQTDFFAVDLTKGEWQLTGNETETLTSLPIDILDTHITDDIVSMLDDETGVFIDCPTTHVGTRVITFNRFLKQSLFPLPNVLIRILNAAQEGFGSPVELEFALRFEDYLGKRRYVLCLLQARAMAAIKNEQRVVMPTVTEKQTLIATTKVMGHGSLDNITNVVFVDPRDFDRSVSEAMATEIGYLNELFFQQKEKFLLLGPGRFGSCNIGIGIPITYSQVSEAKLIAEISTDDLRMEPSQGSHFFHNVVSGGLFYLTIDDKQGGFLNFDWLRSLPNCANTKYAKLLKFELTLSVRVDAQLRKGIVFKN